MFEALTLILVVCIFWVVIHFSNDIFKKERIIAELKHQLEMNKIDYNYDIAMKNLEKERDLKLMEYSYKQDLIAKKRILETDNLSLRDRVEQLNSELLILNSEYSLIKSISETNFGIMKNMEKEKEALCSKIENLEKIIMASGSPVDFSIKTSSFESSEELVSEIKTLEEISGRPVVLSDKF